MAQAMTSDELRKAVEELMELKGYIESFQGEETQLDEERVERLAMGALGYVRRHNDKLAEEEMGWN